MRRYEDERSEDEIEAAYEDESDRDDRLYHQTKDRMLEPRSEWGPNEWRLAQIEGRLEPQGMLRHADGTPYMHVTDYLRGESDEEAQTATTQ